MYRPTTFSEFKEKVIEILSIVPKFEGCTEQEIWTAFMQAFKDEKTGTYRIIRTVVQFLENTD